MIPAGVAETKHGNPIDMRPTLIGEAVYVFTVIDGLDDTLFGDVLG